MKQEIIADSCVPLVEHLEVAIPHSGTKTTKKLILMK